MTDPYFNLHSLYLDFHKAYEAVTSSRSSGLNDRLQHRGAAFGLEVQQAAPNNHLNTLNPYDESFHNPCTDYRFPKVPVRVIYQKEPDQREPLELSDKTRAQQQSDENILFHTSQSELRIDRVWNMDVEASSQSHSINANHPPLDSTSKDTAGNEFNFNASASVSGESLTISPDKAYQKAYRESDKGKVYAQSEKRKAYQKAYRESDKGKAYHKAYQKPYRKAYYEVFKNTGDREQARIAGKQAAAFIRELNKAKK